MLGIPSNVFSLTLAKKYEINSEQKGSKRECSLLVLKQNKVVCLTSLMKSSHVNTMSWNFWCSNRSFCKFGKTFAEKSLLITNTNVIKNRFNISIENYSNENEKLRRKTEGIDKENKARAVTNAKKQW